MRSSTFEIRAARSNFMGRPKLDKSNSIHSNVDLVLMYLIEGVRFVYEKLDV